MSRPRAEMMPLVIDPPRPKGLPAAITHCPTRMLPETPSETAGSGARGVDPQQREVGQFVGADHARLVVGAVLQW